MKHDMHQSQVVFLLSSIMFFTIHYELPNTHVPCQLFAFVHCNKFSFSKKDTRFNKKLSTI